ncbi:MAG: hypothetical protein HC902_14740, partial [Calothrix sp. SM1_5_4]|nr:hypothetical protein [Calothrix sp. SM1_5_4]
MNLGTDFHDLKLKPFEPDPLRSLLQELGFGSFERKIFSDATEPAAARARSKDKSAKQSVPVAPVAPVTPVTP